MRFCPKCGRESRVVDTRFRSNGALRRRRKCCECGHAWSTIEVSLEVFEQLEKVQQTFRHLKELL